MKKAGGSWQRPTKRPNLIPYPAGRNRSGESSSRYSARMTNAKIDSTETFMKRRQRRLPAVLGILVLLLTAAHAGAGEALERLRIKTISLGIVTQRSHAQIEPLLRDFVGYVARRLSPGESIQGRVVV